MREYSRAVPTMTLAELTIMRHDVIHEFLRFVDDETSSMRRPGDDVCETVGLDLVQDRVKFERKSNTHTPTTALIFFCVEAPFHIVRMIMVIMHDEMPLLILCRFSWLLRLAAPFGSALGSIHHDFRRDLGREDVR
jgi:hypothetical protein